MGDYQHFELTDLIICCFYNVYNLLGYGFLEKVYERALSLELKQKGLILAIQQPISVYYHEIKVGDYFCDIIVENKVIVEVKATNSIFAEHEAQLFNYLKATEIEVGLLVNFGPVPQIKRKVFANNRKKFSTTKITLEKHSFDSQQKSLYQQSSDFICVPSKEDETP
jgi:GxxExxY protein